MKILTSQGNRVEVLECFGHSGPFINNDLVVVRVAVDQRPMPPVQIQKEVWYREAATLSEPEFWQNVADAALSMSEVEAMLRN